MVVTYPPNNNNNNDMFIDKDTIKLIYLVKTGDKKNLNEINVTTDEGKDELNRLVYHPIGNELLIFVIKYEHKKPIVVRDILLEVNKEKFKGDVENKEYIRLLQSFMILYDSMLDQISLEPHPTSGL